MKGSKEGHKNSLLLPFHLESQQQTPNFNREKKESIRNKQCGGLVVITESLSGTEPDGKELPGGQVSTGRDPGSSASPEDARAALMGLCKAPCPEPGASPGPAQSRAGNQQLPSQKK